MKKNNLWFTFVELLVVVAIIAIISIAWVFNFISNQSEINFSNDLDKINDLIIEYDNEIWNEITDYEITFFTWASFFVVWENNSYKDYLQNITFNSYTWTITNNSNTWWYFKVDIYKWDKLEQSQILNSSWSVDYSFTWSWDFKIRSYLDGLELNTLKIKSFWDYDLWQEIYLNNINYSWGNLWEVKLKNNLSDNKIIFNWTDEYENIKLTFEKDWIEKTLEINK